MAIKENAKNADWMLIIKKVILQAFIFFKHSVKKVWLIPSLMALVKAEKVKAKDI